MASEIRVNSLTNRSGLSTVSITDTGAVVAGLVTATIFSGPLTGAVTGNVTGDLTGNVTGNVTGNLTGDVTGNTSGTAGGLSGSPSITVTDITATGNVSIGGTLTYEDVTNIDSVGIVTAQSDVLVGRNLSVTSGISTFKTLDYAAIDSTISDTAVDVFIYDTSKDSDGGAWRKRTQHTSWYNETLNTATRGSRREFPAVAVIAYGSGFINIYDGDDPDLPMWMSFSGGYFDTFVTNIPTSISMLNGILVWACKHTNSGYAQNNLVICNFISEKTERISHAGNNYSGTDRTGIVNRNVWTNIETWTGNRPLSLVNYYVNDIAMTVLPNAPIDSATGLPVPTIAVATDGGVSVIKDNGTVVDITHWGSSGYNETDYIEFFENDLVFCMDSVQRELFKLAIPSSDLSLPVTTDVVITTTTGRANAIQVSGSIVNMSTSKVTSDGITAAVGSNGIAKVLDAPNYSTTLSSGITTSYNTGYMHGDIKGAFLSDTDATNVTGSELVTNGDFGTALGSEWVSGNATITIQSGQAKVTSNSGGYSSAYQAITTVIGETYTVSANVNNVSGLNGSSIYIQNGTTLGPAIAITNSIAVGNSGILKKTFTATATTTYIHLTTQSYLANEYSLFDNVSVRIAELDRSVNNNGLQVFGTITKSAVATGAELVGYSFGNSNANYLKQPANLDFQFGTGDFSAMVWINMPDYSQPGFIFDRSDPSGNERFAWYVEGDDLKLYTFDGASASEIGLNTVEIGSAYDGKWVHCVATRHSSGLMEEYINGVLIHSQISTVRQINNADAHMVVGGRYNNTSGNEFDGSIALLRISGSIPSAAQVKKMYEDEKVLFQENAACTLYGSSDAVTALAYDDDTDLLHVGTSSGRSDFQGLRRINNTTTAVTTAITAQNEFIIEQ